MSDHTHLNAPSPPSAAGPGPNSQKTSIVAVLSLILAIATLPTIFCCVGYGTGIVAIVLGVIGLVQVKNGEANPTSKVLSIAGIAVSVLAMAGYSILFMVGIASSPELPSDFSGSGASSEPTSVAEVAPESPAYAMTAIELVKAYEDNELAAESKYEGELVEITGVVGDIKKDILNQPFVTLGSGKALEVRQVQCFLGDDVDATALSKGDRVTLVGRVDGLMMNVLVKECR